MTQLDEAAAQRTAQSAARSRGAEHPELLGAGTEFYFFGARGPQGREGYRIPRSVVFQTPNNPAVYAAELQHKERVLAQWARGYSIPSAQIYQLTEIDSVPVLILEHLQDDGAAVDGADVGRLLARLHQAPPPSSIVQLLAGHDLCTMLTRRLTLRWNHLAERHHLASLPDATSMGAMLKGPCARGSVLHMDVRRQNLRVLGGRIDSLFDWSNALYGPVELEMARLGEYALIEDNGLDAPSVRRGYLNAGGRIEDDGRGFTLFQLDACLMLAVVFDVVAPDEKLCSVFLRRCRELLAGL